MNAAPLDLRVGDIGNSADKRTALETAVAALGYLIREFEAHGGLDQINMAHAYSAEAIGRAVLALDRAANGHA